MSFEKPHKNLNVWKKAIQFVKEVYKTTVHFPKDEKYGLVSQFRRAAVSVPSNIAEGAARETDREFLRFLFISSGSLSELDTLLEITGELDFIEIEKIGKLREKMETISSLLHGLIRRIKKKQKEE